MNRRRIGERGEALAADYLCRKGYTPIESNFRTREGEIDLIMRDGNVLVFVEVKHRRGTDFGDPLEAVTPRKQARIRRVAEQYLALKEEDCEEVRFDVVGILSTGAGNPQVQHVLSAF